jgi:TFIIF-interacting CTD phosphatase-like protein
VLVRLRSQKWAWVMQHVCESVLWKAQHSLKSSSRRLTHVQSRGLHKSPFSQHAMGANDLPSRQDSPESTSKVLYLPGRDPLGRYQNGEDRQRKTLKAARKRICLMVTRLVLIL